MKRFLSLLLFFMIIAIGNNAAQTLQISVPSNACAGQNIPALVTVTSASLTFHSWSIYPPEQISTGLSVTNTQVSISFTSCGNHTVVCSSYNSAAVFTGSTSTTINVICPGVTVTPVTQTICAGSNATISAAGAGSYTWSSSQNTPVINPSPLSTTVYSVIGSVNACMGTATVIVSTTPTIYITSNPTGSFVCAGFTSTLQAYGATNYTWTGSNFSIPINQPSISVSPGTSTSAPCTTFQVIGGSAVANCTSNIATFNLCLAPPLNIITAISSPTTCIETNYSPGKLSKPVTITVSGAQTYTWSLYNPLVPIIGSPVTVRPAVSTCYTVTGLTPVCSGSAIACVFVIPQFTMDVSPVTSTICIGDSIKLSIGNIQQPLAVGPASLMTYYWWDPPNSPPPSITAQNTPTVKVFPQTNTTYTVEVYDARGCASMPFLVTVNTMTCLDTGVPSSDYKYDQIRIYPNPVGDDLFIQTTVKLVNLSLQLTDVIGKQISSESPVLKGSENTYVLNVSKLKPGVYFVILFSDKKIISRYKFLKS